MKYGCCFPSDIEKLSRHLFKYVEGKDKIPNVDIENTKLIQQFIYNKDDIDKIEKNHKYYYIMYVMYYDVFAVGCL